MLLGKAVASECYMQRALGRPFMTSDKAFYRAFVEGLKVLGKPNVELVLRALEEENIVQGETLDRDRLEPALRSIFGEGAKVFLEFAKSPKATH